MFTRGGIRWVDSIDWELLLKAVRRQTNCAWVLLYIERWLKAPVQMEDGKRSDDVETGGWHFLRDQLGGSARKR